MMFVGLPPSIEHIRRGSLRVLAVTTSARWETLPDTPSLGDFLPGYEADQWWGIGLRKSTPTEIIEKLNKEMNAILPQIQTRVIDLGGRVVAGSPVDLEKFVVSDTEKLAKVVKLARVKAE